MGKGNGINIAAQEMATKAELALDRQNEFGGQALAGEDPLANGRLPFSDEPAEGRLPAGELDGVQQCRGVGVNNRHAEQPNGTPLGIQSEKRPSLAIGKAIHNGGNGRSVGSTRESVCSGVDELRTITGERIQQRLAELHISQAELARRCGLAQSTVNGLINGHSRSSAHLHVIARQLGVSTAWLAGVRAADDRGGAGDESATGGFAVVPEIRLSALGSGIDELLPVVAQVPVSKMWLQSWLGNADSELVYVTRAEGDDMAPTIGRGDMIVLDASETEIRLQDKLFALGLGGVGMVKRVRKLGDGRVELRSDNPAVSPMVVDVDELRVIASVAAVMKRV